MLRVFLVVTFLAGSIALGADLAHSAYAAAQTAHTVVLAPLNA